MKKHNGMRPQDIVVMLKIVAMKDREWRGMDLARQLFLSQSEVSEALERNRIAGLLSNDKRRVNSGALLEFLVSGLKYVFPVEPGPVVRGTLTAASAEPLSRHFVKTGDVYVWPFEEGTSRGQTIVPLYPTAPRAVIHDKILYELLSLVDAIRIGRARERNFAARELAKRLKVS